ncbi:MAG: hypothetical protein MUC29_00335 [Pyrinomonadaceae bacterium]|nr:hypothetical protein [Pyrinomonadaceae bacterium]
MKKKLFFLTILAFVVVTSACNFASNQTNVNQNAQTNANAAIAQTNVAIAENKTTENNAIENKPKAENVVNKQVDEFPKFKKGEEYKSVRQKLIKAGWTPFKSKEAQECVGDDDRCKDFPEMEACAGTGLGNCRYLFKKNNKTLAIFTIGDIPVYNDQEFVKSSMQSKIDKEDSSWQGGALVHTPPTNIRESPAGKVICVIREKKVIMVSGSTNITDDNGEWIRTNACGKSGVVHSSQINMGN